MRAIFYDTETTGLNAKTDRIIEIAAYDASRDTTFTTLVNPGCPIPAESTAISHIDDAMVAEAPDFAKAGRDFADFCDGDAVLIAHNNDSFDVRFLRNEFARHSLSMPDWKFLDSLKWARRYRPDLPKHSLQFLREVYGVTANNAHRALDDVIVLHKLFTLMTDDLPIETTFQLMSTPSKLARMPFGKHRGLPLSQLPPGYLRWLKGSGALEEPENQPLRASLEALGLMQD